MSDQGRVAGKVQQTITLGGGRIAAVASPSMMVIPGAKAGNRYVIGRPGKTVPVSVLSVDSDNYSKLSADVHGCVEGDPFAREYTLKPYVVGIWAEMSSFVRSLKGDPIKEICDRLDSIPPEQQARWMKVAVDAASNQSPTEVELAAFEKSLLGTAFKLWSTLKADHVDEFPTPQSVMDKLISLSETEGEKKLAEIMLKLEVASGEADIKNLPGPPATTV
jgi:hypothetical protein